MTTKKLTPPDPNQCQAEVPGNGPFTMGGAIGDPRRGYRVRCTNKPVVVATEVERGADGHRGSMSLCESCLEAFKKQMGEDFATFKRTPSKKAASKK